MKQDAIRLLLVSVWFLFIAPIANAKQQPNILFIAVDDLRPELGCYDNTHIKSPNIDALAKRSTVFTRAYCQQAVCNPSRVSYLTGLRPDSTKVWDLITEFRDVLPNVVTLPQHFKNNGYTTLGYGKIFHNPWPDNVSWSEPHAWPRNSQLWSQKARQDLNTFKNKLRDDGKPQRLIDRLRAQATEIVDIPDEQHIDGAITEQTLRAMRRLAKQDQPFFLAAGFIRPHLPFVVPRKYWELYDRSQIPLVKDPELPTGSPKFAMNTMYELRDYYDLLDTSDPRQGPLTDAQQRELKHGYYAAVSYIDAQIGRLLAELKRLQLEDNTIIVLWGDHGWKLGEHRSWCKQTNYEIDTRVPLIIHAPGITTGQKCDNIVESIDVYPTLCELTDIEKPKHIQGNTLLKLLKNNKAVGKNVAFSQFPRRDGNKQYMGYAMRTDRYRYIEWLDRKTCGTVTTELYNHDVDPKESRNIASRFPTIVAELSAQMWKSLPHPKAGDLDKTMKKRPVIQFRNTSTKTVEIYWLAPDGRRVLSGTIEPKRSMRRLTTLSHRFQVGKSGPIFSVAKDEQTFSIDDDPIPDQKNTQNRPNILVLMGDDWSWPHAGFLGDPVAKTPTFDRLASEGVLFKNAFVSSPSCTPSRFSIASGQWHWRLKEGANLGGSLEKNVPVYADILKKNGYETGFSRKGASPSKHVYRQNDPFGPRFQSFDEFLKQRTANQPFCFWYGAGEPHRPYRSGAGIKNGFDPDHIVVPKCLPDDLTVRSDLCDYHEAVSRFDNAADRMLKLLEKLGELDNTLIIVSGDNGLPFPRCKATLYDTGTRVPLVIHWSAGLHGKRHVTDFVSLTDLAPTILQAAGLPIPKEMTGRSLMPILISNKSGQIDPERNYVLTGMERHVYANPSRAIRTNDFLFIRNYESDRWLTGESNSPTPRIDFTDGSWPTFSGAFSFNIDPSPTKQLLLDNRNNLKLKPYFNLACGRRPEIELYDLKKDPHQLINVADDKMYASIKATLDRRLNARLRESNDPRVQQPNVLNLR